MKMKEKINIINFNRLKIGDKLIVKEELITGDRYGCNHVNNEMKKLEGEVVTIKNFSGDVRNFRIEESLWWWTAEMIKSYFNENEFEKFRDEYKKEDEIEIDKIRDEIEDEDEDEDYVPW